MLMVNKPSKTCAHMAHIILLLPYALLKASKASIGRCLVLRPYIYRGSNLDFEGVYFDTGDIFACQQLQRTLYARA